MNIVTCFHRGGNHGYNGDEDGGNDVDDGEEEMNLDWSVPLWVLPPEVGEAEDSQAYGHLGEEDGGRVAMMVVLPR